MSEYPCYLEPYKSRASRYVCPSCDKKEFVRYLDRETEQHLPGKYGRCNRLNKCGYHLNPLTDGYYKSDESSHTMRKHSNWVKPQVLPKPVSLIPAAIFKVSLQRYERNHFTIFLTALIGPELTKQSIGRYFIGTSQYWPGATVFYQIDIKGRIKAGKIMLYNFSTGKRVKEPFNHLNWTHKEFRLNDYNLQQCFFGEHLLTQEPTKPVAIVESEKTAIIASIYMPDFVWLAAGNKYGLKAEKCQVLKGRQVVLFPDLKAYDYWSAKARELEDIVALSVSDLLERKASKSHKEQGYDLADYLIGANQQGVNPSVSKLEPTITDVATVSSTCNWTFKKNLPPTPEPDKDIIELESFFKTAALPREIQLNQCSRILNLPLFLKAHFSTIKLNHGKRSVMPYMERLIQLKRVLLTTR